MGSSETDEKSGEFSNPENEKVVSTITSNLDTPPQTKKLHHVQRGEVLPDYGGSEENIVGDDAELMRARASLTAEEEKKLLWRG
ncbi:hypothetical protein ACEPPN_001489 [Leptodophora sp. 'Broadleaf-Isolate-01']